MTNTLSCRSLGVQTDLRFVADGTLGRLAKWLRILGYDTLYNPSPEGAHLIRVARAQDRILLTRNLRLTRRAGVCSLWLTSPTLSEQLQQLHDELDIGAIAPWSRCPVCNVPLLSVTKDQAWGQVPPYVFVNQDAFRLCPSCDRYYWKGTHRQRMQQLVERWSGL